MRLAQAQVRDPDIRDQLRERNRELGRPLGLEGVYDAMRGLPRTLYNQGLRTAARASIAATIHLPTTSPTAREVLSSFLTGRGPRRFRFGPTSEGVRELFRGGPSGYFGSHELAAMEYIAKRERRSYLQDGDELTRHAFRDFGWPESSGLVDGTQIGDITGTLSDGISARVRRGRVYFRAVNRMNLVSYAGGNLFPVQEGWVDLPERGPLSEVEMVFEWSRPIPPHLRRHDGR